MTCCIVPNIPYYKFENSITQVSYLIVDSPPCPELVRDEHWHESQTDETPLQIPYTKETAHDRKEVRNLDSITDSTEISPLNAPILSFPVTAGAEGQRRGQGRGGGEQHLLQALRQQVEQVS